MKTMKINELVSELKEHGDEPTVKVWSKGADKAYPISNDAAGTTCAYITIEDRNLVDEPKEDDRPVTERIKTFEDAVDILGDDNQAVIDYYAVADSLCSKDILAFAKLRVIAAALNEGWEPTFDKDERRHYPWFYVYTKREYEELDEYEKKSCRVPLRSNCHASAYGGLIFTNAIHAGSNSCAYIGVWLTFKTKELAEYCGKQFINEWADFLFA